MAILKDARKGDTPKRDAAPRRATPQRDTARRAPAEPAQGGQQRATPEQQEAYTKLVTAAIKAIYDDATHKGVVKMLGSGDPPQALAQTTASIIQKLDEQSGGKIPQVVILPAAAEILGELAKLAETAKIFEADQRVTAQAMQRLVITLAEAYGADPAQLQSLIQSMPQEEIQRIVAEQSGYAQAGAPQQPAAATQPPGAQAPQQPQQPTKPPAQPAQPGA